MNVEIANKLVTLRKEMGLSQEELAERIGVSRQAVSKWERAESSPDLDNIVLLAKLYDISLDELLLSGSAGESRGVNVPRPFEPREEAIIAQEQPSELSEMVEKFSEEVDSVSRRVESSLSGGFELRLETELPEIGDYDEEECGEDDGEDDEDEEVYAESYTEEADGKRGKSKSIVINALDGAFPIIVLSFYLVCGFWLRWWHPTWIMFLLIPLYYTMMPGIMRINAIIRGEREGSLLRAVKKMLDASYPILCAFFFILLGTFFNFWHPTWMLFLTIPLYYVLMPAIVKACE